MLKFAQAPIFLSCNTILKNITPFKYRDKHIYQVDILLYTVCTNVLVGDLQLFTLHINTGINKFGLR